MRIAICSPVNISNYSGAARILCETAKLLSKKGHSVTMYTLPFGPNRLLNVDELTRTLGDISYQEKWKHKIKNVDIVYTSYIPFVWRQFQNNSKRMAAILTHLLFPSQYLMETIANPIQSIKNGWLSKVILFDAILPFIPSDLLSFTAVHLPNKNIHVGHSWECHVPLWTSADVFKPCGKKWDRFTVLFAGRHNWEKGWDRYLRIAVKLKRLGYDFDFVSTGRGEGVVKGLGFLSDNDLAKSYAKAHITIYPSIGDVFGLVAVESAMCGTPVITTPIQTHVDLDLPIAYAQTDDEFIQEILRVYKLWIREKEYKLLCSTLRKDAMKYDIKIVFPIFEDMLEKVAFS